MNRWFSRYTLNFLLILISGSLQAGTLWLNNGDRISGEPDELSGGILAWQSNTAGPLKINQASIKFIETDLEMVLQIGQEALLDHCHFEVDDGKPVEPRPPTEMKGNLPADQQPAETTALNQPETGITTAGLPQSSATEAASDQAGDSEPTESRVDTIKPAIEVKKPVLPEQWVMCEDRGFILTSWKQVSRFFEFRPPEPDRLKSSGSILLAIEDETGNTDERTIDWDIRTELRYRKSRHIITFENTLESKSGKDTKDERMIAYQSDRFVTDRWFFAGNGSWEENKFKDISSKWIVGAGAGYQFFETDLLTLSTQGGVSYVDEEFNTADEPRDYPALRWSTNYRWVVDESGLEFFHTNVMYQSLQSTSNWNIDSNTGFTLPMIGRLKANFIFEYDYDNLPASGFEKEDRIWKVGFSYNWP